MGTNVDEICCNALPPLWEQFLEDINCSTLTGEPLLMELINESIIDYEVISHFLMLREYSSLLS